jgi:hypothetical protein
MNYRNELLSGLVFLGAICVQAQTPNVIVVMSDDLGYVDVGFNGFSEIPPPNIDRIAKNGVRYAVQWEGVLPVGTTYGKLGSSLDILGTIADLALAPTDPKKPLDGVNLIPYLSGKKEKAQLYNLETDISEEQDIAGYHPEKMQEIDQLRLKWDSELIKSAFRSLGSSNKARKNQGEL